MDEKLKSDWVRTLERLRFDLVRRDPLQAHKEYDSRRTANLWIDESGQVRMTVTRQSGETRREKRKSRAGREYLVFVEQNAVTIVNYRLGTNDDLGAIVAEIESEIAKG